MNSQIFSGATIHCRHSPQRHAFEYKMFWLSIDLDELPKLDREIGLFRHNARALVSILDRDYGGLADGDIKQRIGQHLERAGIDEPLGRVELMTIPRIAGYVFNPVSFYLCSSPEGTIYALVAEVRNTFGEMHHYVTRLEPDPTNPSAYACRIPKQFYVSPFFRVDGEYHIRMEKSGEEFSISISLHDHTGLAFSASMFGQGQELNTRNLRRTLCRLPFFALTIMTKIHWQALKLYFGRRLGMFEKPPPSHPATLPASNTPWWLRLRSALVRLAARQRPPSSLQSDNNFSRDDS
tara:strand:+ start:68820 stop:69701 length:882 start_codon:yes stop_codon:yes gene_type:complete